MKNCTLLLLLFFFSGSLNAQWMTSNPPGPDYCALETVTYTYSPVNPNNIVNWIVEDYGPFAWSGTPYTAMAGTGNVLTIAPFQLYSPGIVVMAQETDSNGTVVGQAYEHSVWHYQSPIPAYFYNINCGSLHVALPYDGLIPGINQRWSMWYRDGVATGWPQGQLDGPLPGGTYVYKLKLSCSTDTLVSDPIIINGIGQPIVLATGPTTFCDGDSVTLALQPGFSVYNWLKNGVGIPGTSSMSSLKVTTSGNYSVQVYSQTGGGNCYQVSTPIAVTVNPAAIITGPNVACSGDTVTLQCTPANSYQWYRYGTIIPGATSQFLSVTQSGNYTVITSGLACDTSSVHNFQIYAKPSNIAISQSGPISLCKFESLTLTVTGNNITSWNWLRNGVSMPGSNTPTVTVTKAGNYKCVVSNAIGCSKTSQVAKLTYPAANNLPSKSITIKPGPSGTDSYSTSAFGSSGTNYGNATSMEVSAWYKHFRTAERGYLKFDLSAIPENSPIVSANLKLYTDTAVIYQNGTQTLFVKRLTENWAENTISWNVAPDSTGFQPASIPVNAAQSNTTISMSITDIVRHWSTLPAENFGVLLHLEEYISSTVQVGWMSFYSGDNANASLRPKLTVKYAYADITENGPLSFCAGGSVLFSTNPGYNYQWYLNNNAIAGANADTYTATTAGDYYVIMSNSAGCTVQSATKTVVVPCREGQINNEEIVIIHQQNSEEIKVILPGSEGLISVYDITGRLMNSYDCSDSECNLTTSQFTPGIYVVHVNSGGNVKMKKVMIE